jgi:hypothetical protein
MRSSWTCLFFLHAPLWHISPRFIWPPNQSHQYSPYSTKDRERERERRDFLAIVGGVCFLTINMYCVLWLFVPAQWATCAIIYSSQWPRYYVQLWDNNKQSNTQKSQKKRKKKEYRPTFQKQSKMVRAPCCEKMGLKKGPWTSEEDQILINYIQQYGHGNWRALPKQAGNYISSWASLNWSYDQDISCSSTCSGSQVIPSN